MIFWVKSTPLGSLIFPNFFFVNDQGRTFPIHKRKKPGENLKKKGSALQLIPSHSGGSDGDRTEPSRVTLGTL